MCADFHAHVASHVVAWYAGRPGPGEDAHVALVGLQHVGEVEGRGVGRERAGRLHTRAPRRCCARCAPPPLAARGPARYRLCAWSWIVTDPNEPTFTGAVHQATSRSGQHHALWETPGRAGTAATGARSAPPARDQPAGRGCSPSPRTHARYARRP